MRTPVGLGDGLAVGVGDKVMVEVAPPRLVLVGVTVRVTVGLRVRVGVRLGVGVTVTVGVEARVKVTSSIQTVTGAVMAPDIPGTWKPICWTWLGPAGLRVKVTWVQEVARLPCQAPTFQFQETGPPGPWVMLASKTWAFPDELEALYQKLMVLPAGTWMGVVEKSK